MTCRGNVHANLLTSAILVAEIGKSPDVAQPDTVTDTRQHELRRRRPFPAPSRRRRPVVVRLRDTADVADLRRRGRFFADVAAAAVARLAHAPC